MKIYISGKITGLSPEQVAEKFARAERQILAFGHEPVNPLNNGLSPNVDWNKQMAASVGMLLECDAIYMLPDWGDSKGARIEANIATEIGLEIIHQPEYGRYESKL